METAEEILKAKVNKALWIFISEYFITHKFNEKNITFKDQIIEVMQEYAEDYHQEQIEVELEKVDIPNTSNYLFHIKHDQSPQVMSMDQIIFKCLNDFKDNSNSVPYKNFKGVTDWIISQLKEVYGK